MKLISIRCPNCGGEIKANTEKEKLTCGYCHTEFLLDDEVKRSETHHIYTDEAKIKKAEIDKEIELKKLEIESKKLDMEKTKRKTYVIIVFTLIIISVILLLLAVLAMNDILDSEVADACYSILGTLWFFAFVVIVVIVKKQNKKEKNGGN